MRGAENFSDVTLAAVLRAPKYLSAEMDKVKQTLNLAYDQNYQSKGSGSILINKAVNYQSGFYLNLFDLSQFT